VLSNRIARLAPPPRRVPLPVVCSAMLGTAEGAGTFVSILVMLGCWLFARDFQPVDELRMAFSMTTAPANVMEVTATGASVNEVEVYEYRFTFSAPDGRTITGRCYSTGRLWSVGDQVAAWYVPDDPAIARLDRTRLSKFSPWFAWLTIALSIVFAMCSANSIVHRLHQVMLLRYGKITNARKIWTKETSISVPVVVNGKPGYDLDRYTLQKYAVARYTYLFQASDGRIYRGTCKAPASEVVGDEAAEPILYLPSDPHVSTLVDALPLRYPLDVDDAGQWVSYEDEEQVVWFVLVWLVIALAVGYGLSRLLGLL
jgi:hypothetical protein